MIVSTILFALARLSLCSRLEFDRIASKKDCFNGYRKHLGSDGILFVFMAANAVFAFFLAKLLWFYSLHIVIRIPLWGFLVGAGVLFAWMVTGGIIHSMRGEFDAVIRTTYGLTGAAAYFLQRGAEAGAGSILGASLWIVIRLSRYVTALYKSYQETGLTIPKRWRIAFFLTLIWPLCAGAVVLLFQPYGNRMSSGDDLHFILVMLIPTCLGLGLFWVYEKLVR